MFAGFDALCVSVNVYFAIFNTPSKSVGRVRSSQVCTLGISNQDKCELISLDPARGELDSRQPIVNSQSHLLVMM